jgi:predicted nucleic acid-binding protein
MTRRERYVFDTNVIVSALLFEQSKRGELVLSLPVVKELNDVLSRPKFDRYVFREEREKFLVKNERLG